MEQIEASSEKIQEKTVKPRDLKELMNIWENWYGDIALAIRPGEGVMDWRSHTSDIKVSVFLKNGEIIGYVRYNKNNLNDIRMLIAKNEQVTMEILKYLKNYTSMNSIELPIHPDSLAIKFFKDLEYKVDFQTWDAGMIKILDDKDKDIETYCREDQEGKRKAGLIVYPTSYDMA